MLIGVLALQGAFIEHQKMLATLGVKSLEVKLPEDLKNLDGLIIPGGESTAISKLASDYQLIEPLKKFCKSKAVWGTCAGMILLADQVLDGTKCLTAIDIEVQRNAFGSQKDSFVEKVNIEGITEQADFPAVFIRAPSISKVGENIKIISKLADGTVVAAESDNILVCAFHPELSNDTRMHKHFIKMINKLN